MSKIIKDIDVYESPFYGADRVKYTIEVAMPIGKARTVVFIIQDEDGKEVDRETRNVKRQFIVGM